MDRLTILDQHQDLSAEVLADHIIRGVISLDDLRNVGLERSKRHAIQQIISQHPHTAPTPAVQPAPMAQPDSATLIDIPSDDETDWHRTIQSNTEEAYRRYRDLYPDGAHREEALDRIFEIVSNRADENTEPTTPPAQQPRFHNIPSPGAATQQYDSSEQDWRSINKDDITALEQFRKQYPTSPHRAEALGLIRQLRAIANLTGEDRIRRVLDTVDGTEDIARALIQLMSNGQATEGDLVNIIKADKNVMSIDVVKMIIDANELDPHALYDADIPAEFIAPLDMGQMPYDPNLGFKTDVALLERIPDGFTEIYFWGVPASGKTCAVGSIMSTMIREGGGQPHSDSQGTRYMMPLAATFREHEVCVLPPRTRVEETFEMRYTLRDSKGDMHHVAFIDLSGELFECMYLSEAGEPLSPKQQAAINVLQNILVNNRSHNPKIHFFVIEYGSENNMYKGMSQNALLHAAIDYLDRYNVLKDNTIGAYIILTKADKAGEENIGEYIDRHYSNFTTNLMAMMKRWQINTRKGKPQLKRFPFSIGDVCFQKWCLYDPDWTQYIIDEIKDRSYGIETGWFAKFKEGAKK